MRVKRFGLLPERFFSGASVFESRRFDFFVTPGLVRVRHGRPRSKTFSCTAEVAHGYRCVHKQVFGRCGVGETQTSSSAQAPGLAAYAIGAESASMGIRVRRSD